VVITLTHGYEVLLRKEVLAGKNKKRTKSNRVPVAHDKDKKTKGADNHKDYMETYNSMIMRAVESAVECDQYVRAAATQAQTTLFKDFNITITHSWSALLSHYLPRVACKCPLPHSTKTGGTQIPLAVEERIANVVRRVRIT
jgi:hypothetical protein